MVPSSDVPLTWGAQVAHAERLLAGYAGTSARDEALTMLGALLGEPVTLLLARPNTPMRPEDVETYASWVERRVTGEVIPHITGHLAFMGLNLAVTSDSPLVSPAAQGLVEVALECARYRTPGELSGAHVGAGCGALAMALVTFEPRFARIYAVDPSRDALRVAAANGVRYLLNLVIDWREGDGLDAVPEPVDLIVCDLPARLEAAQSVDVPGARAATLSSHVERLFEQASEKLRPGGTLLCALDGELEPEALAALARRLPAARIWATPSSGGLFIAAAQLPRSATS